MESTNLDYNGINKFRDRICLSERKYMREKTLKNLIQIFKVFI